jgi:LysM repeat protein
MSDFHDTQYWDDPDWNSTRAIAADPASQISGTSQNGRNRLERTRTHHVVTSRPTDESYDDFTGDWAPVDHWVEPEVHRARRLGGVDPRLLRIGAVAAAGVLMIPITLALRDKPTDGVRSEVDVPTTTVVPITAAPQVLAAPVETVVTVLAAAPVTASPQGPAVEAASGGASARGAAAVVAAPKPAKPVCAGTYTVIANDYWNRFPKSSGASVAKWLAANNAAADTPLYVGDKLCIPAGATAPAPPTPPTTTQPPTTTPPPATTTPAPATTKAAPAATKAAPVATKAPVIAPPPTAAPVTTAAPVVTVAKPPTRGAVVPAPSTDAATVEALIREIWPDDIEDRAVAIATRESHLNPNVHNYCCYGVFAIYFDMGKNFLPQMGITSPQQLFDPRTNITAAYKLYTLAGWKPWAQTDPGS